MAKLYQQLCFDDYLSMSDHISTIHCDSSGWITVANKSNSWQQYHYHAAQLLENPSLITDITVYDCYISQNTFYMPSKRIENIRELRALYVDIDTYKRGITKQTALYYLDDLINDGKMPRPNIIVDSGQGIHCIWCIHSLPYMALPLWNAVEKYLFAIIEKLDIGADPDATDASRVLRLAGTYNSKSNTKASIIETYPIKYHLRDIQENYLPELKKEPKPAQKRQNFNSNVSHLYNIYSLHFTRLNDLIRLLELRDYDIGPRFNQFGEREKLGSREKLLFLYRYWTCCYTHDKKSALEAAIELNYQLKDPLPEYEVIKATKSAERTYLTGRYNYTNETLIKLFEITSEEQRHLETIIGKEEKYRRNNERRTPRNEEGRTPRQQKKHQTGETLRQLRQQGKTIAEISRITGISRKTLYETYSHYIKID